MVAREPELVAGVDSELAVDPLVGSATGLLPKLEPDGRAGAQAGEARQEPAPQGGIVVADADTGIWMIAE